jgi:DNA replicative helicase MCM subunit Mcm2 (Cdc46/Mcm family)
MLFNSIEVKGMIKENKQILNDEYEGVDICPHCDSEIYYSIQPVKEIRVKCPKCGKLCMPCNLCNRPYGCSCGSDLDDCRKSVFKTIIDENTKY